MTRFEKWSIGLATTVVSASGLLYLWVRYFVTPTDPFSVINHPLQPYLLQVHLLAAPPLVLLFGMVLQSHILKKLRSGYRPNRRSGLVALWTFGVMTMSGYLLQMVTAPLVTTVVVWLHVGSGGVFTLSYVVHLAISLRLAAIEPRRRIDPGRALSGAR
jgi:hypothetical protein